MATGEDSTGRDVLQDVAGSDSFLIHAAVKCRKISRHFGWPHLVFLALAPTFPLRWDASLPLFFVMGIPSVLLGVGLRLWARGFQRSTDGLVIDGPYRYVRNPVEVGAIACFVGA
ncbi:MAG: hypothetical protein JST16_00940, partial [Bdellovibrionales bacterium]|nr:hypothetical protein [Bdellovibrionales bacterium]